MKALRHIFSVLEFPHDCSNIQYGRSMYHLKGKLNKLSKTISFLLITVLFFLSGCSGGSSSGGESTNTAPTFLSSLNNFNIEVGANLSVNLIAEDIENDELSFEYDELPSFISANENSGILSLDFRPEVGDEGAYSLEIVVSDGTNSSSQVKIFNVIDTDSSALVNSIADKTVTEEQSLELSFAVDSSVGTNFRLVDDSSPDFVSLSISDDLNIDISPKLSDAGSYTVSFSLTDGFRTQDISFSVVVDTYAFEPELSITDSVELVEGEIVNIELINAAQKDNVSINSALLPDFASVVVRNDGSTYVEIKPDFFDAGSYEISLVFENSITQTPEFFVSVVVGQGYSGNITDLSLGAYHSCAIENYEVYCWGLNDVGQRSVPDNLAEMEIVASGSYHTCAASDSIVDCWGGNSNGETNVPDGLVNVIKMEAGYEHTCALTSGGDVHCWGSNHDGFSAYIGQSEVPESLGNVTDIAVGFWHSCALDQSGWQCWGDNRWGQSSVPNDLGVVTQFSAGRLLTCATDEGVLECWGTNDGYGQSSLPNDLGEISDMDVGFFFNTCVIDDGEVRCWGAGETDTGSYPRFGQSIVPVGLVNPLEVSVGDAHSCALDDYGVTCWGEGSEEDIGGSDNYSQATVPEFLQAP